MFDSLRREQSNMLEKIVVVAGDVSQVGFGLSPSDLKLLVENVSVVFNLAATVRFDEDLKAALKMNVKGPTSLLEICRKMKHLKVIINYCCYSCKISRRAVT